MQHLLEVGRQYRRVLPLWGLGCLVLDTGKTTPGSGTVPTTFGRARAVARSKAVRLRSPLCRQPRTSGILRQNLTRQSRRTLAGRALLSKRGDHLDEDLEALTKEQLIAEAKRLRAGIRAHRDSTGHDLCWHHPDLWRLLPEQVDVRPWIPTWPRFMEGCIRYRAMLDRELADAPRRDERFSGASLEQVNPRKDPTDSL